MFEQILAEAIEAMSPATRAKAKASDYGDPENNKFPIMSQASVLSAARLLGRAKGYDDAKRAAVKARVVRIAKRKGYSLPKAWQTKKEGIDAATMSDQMVADAIQAALMEDPDPDCDGDVDQQPNDWGYVEWEDGCPRVRHVFSDAPVPYFVFQLGWDGDYFRRTYTIDDNAEAVNGNTAQRVRPMISFIDVTGTEEDVEESFIDVMGLPRDLAARVVVSESSRPTGTVYRETLETAHFREAEVDAKGMFHISGTAIDPGVNASGTRIYSKETLAAAMPLFVGAKMYIDHPTSIEEKTQPERSVQKLAGRIESATINGRGGIDYSAVVFHPQMREMLANMKEVDALDALGTSINYHGTATPVQYEGATLDNIDSITKLNSLDFVTDAGAWGTVASMESLTGNPVAKQGEDAVTNEELTALVEKMAGSIGTLTTAVTGLAERQVRTEVRTEMARVLAASGLPTVAQDDLLERFKDAQTIDGFAEAVAKQQAFVASLTEGLVRPGTKGEPKTAARLPVTRVESIKVEGLGKTGEGAEADELPKPTRESFVADFGNLIQGGPAAAEALYRVIG
jgi:hypothetical protein